MNIYQCQKWAEENGFDSCEFYADFPSGTFKCQWLDAYFGMILIPDVLGDSFIRVSDIDDMFPNLVCNPIQKEVV